MIEEKNRLNQLMKNLLTLIEDRKKKLKDLRITINFLDIALRRDKGDCWGLVRFTYKGTYT